MAPRVPGSLPSNVFDLVSAQQDQAAATAMAYFDPDEKNDPRKAARAHDFEQHTGVPGDIIYDAMPEFEYDRRSKLAGNIIRDSDELGEYIRSHPLAPRVSANDWANMHEAGQSLKAFGENSIVGTLVRNLKYSGPLAFGVSTAFDPQAWEDTWDQFKAGWHSMHEGFTTPTGDIIEQQKKEREENKKYLKEHGLYHRTPEQEAEDERLAQIADPATARRIRTFQQVLGPAFGYAQMRYSHVLGGLRTYGSRPLSEATGVPLDTIEGYGMVLAAAVGLKVHAGLEDQKRIDRRIDAIHVRTTPWYKRGREVPVGADDLTDRMKAAEADVDAKLFERAFQDFGKMETRELSPELARDFAKLYPEATKVEIPLEAVRELYGDKLPSPEDGLLGFVDGIREQFESAQKYGGEITIPRGEFMSHVPKEVFDALKEDLRLRPNGVTLREAKEIMAKELPEEIPTSDFSKVGVDETQQVVDDVRRSSRLPGWDYIEAAEPYVPVRDSFKLKMRQLPFTMNVEGVVDGKRTRIGNRRITSVGSTTLREALDDAKFFLPDYKILPNDISLIIDRIKELAGDTMIHVVSDADMKAAGSGGAGGFNDSINNHVVIRESVFRQGGMGEFGNSTVLHEAIHAATVKAIMLKPELKNMIRNIMDELAKIDPILEDTYGWTNEKEFLAEAFSNKGFQKRLAETRISPDLARQMGITDWRNTTVFRAIVDFVRFALSLPREAVSGLEAALMAFDKVSEGQKVLTPQEQGVLGIWKQMVADLPEMLPVTEQAKMPSESIEPGAAGLTKEMLGKLEKLMKEQHEKDMAAQRKRGERYEQWKQSDQWKVDERETTKEVKSDINGKRDIVLGLFFRAGEYMGVKLSDMPKIDPTHLSDADRATLPFNLMKKGGMNPDDLAGMFGFHTGRELLDALKDFEAKRGDKPAKDYVNKLVKDEVDKRMKYKFGDLGDNVIEEAETHALGLDAMDLLHEQTVAAAMHAGVGIDALKTANGLPFSKKNVLAWAGDMFNRSRFGDVTVQKYLRYAGKAGKVVENLLKDKPAEALQAQQEQFYQAALAREAKAFEKEQKAMDKLAKKYSSSRNVEGIEPEFLNFIHQLLGRFERLNTNKVPLADLQERINEHPWPTLDRFWQHTVRMGNPFVMAEWLVDPSIAKSMDKLTNGEWRDVRDTIKSLDKIGREWRMQNVGSEKKVRASAIADLAKKQDEYGLPKWETPVGRFKTNKYYEGMRAWLSSMINAESILNRLDLGDPDGFLHRAIVYPMGKAAANFHGTLRRYQVKLREALKDVKPKDLKVRVDNDLWTDPNTGRLMNFTRLNVYGILQQVGNKSNRAKLFPGYKVEEGEGMSWLWRQLEATGDPVGAIKRAQRIGKVLRELYDETSDMHSDLTGVPLEKIELDTLQTPWGDFDGWHHPVAFETRFAGDTIVPAHGLFDPGWVGAPLPTEGFAKQRTKVIAPTELNFQVIPLRIRQMAHDLSFREALIDSHKLISDPAFKRMAINAVGDNMYGELRQWVQDVANMQNQSNFASLYGHTMTEMIRQNLISVLIGWNPATVVKHGATALINSMTQVGIKDFNRELFSIMSKDEFGERQWSLALGKSEFLRQRRRNWNDMFGEPIITLEKQGLRETMINLGAQPVAFFDMLSAVPTWLVEYKRGMARGLHEGEAVARADDAVVQAHGSNVVTNRPRIMRSRNPIASYFTSLYGFFSHMFQKHYELAWRTRDAWHGRSDVRPGELPQEYQKHLKIISLGVFSYVLAPAIIEHLVTPYIAGDPDESLGEEAFWAILNGTSSSYIGLKDFVRGVVNLKDPETGLIGEAWKPFYNLTKAARDPGKYLDENHFGRTAGSVIEAIGIATGMTYRSQGKAFEFIYRYMHDLEDPAGLGLLHAILPEGLHEQFGAEEPGWLTGLKKGTLKKPPKRRP